MEELIYWRHKTPVGIKIEEVCGGEDKSGKLWLELAYQIYCENGREGYRDIEHFPSGAPRLDGEECRISISHAQGRQGGGLLVVASLPDTPEVNLSEFTERTAMGVDAERIDRDQVLRLRDKFLTDNEQALVPADDVLLNLQAWTAKEALLKASMRRDIDWRRDLQIIELPHIDTTDEMLGLVNGKLVKNPRKPILGRARITLGDTTHDMLLYSYLTEDWIVTIAYSPRCATHKKS